jgi:hypothetical protein
MREIDKRECRAFGRSPKDALRISLKTSFHALTALDPGWESPCDVRSVSARHAVRQGNAVVPRDRRRVRLRTRPDAARPAIIAWFSETFPEMDNLVSAENVKAIRLLKAWGAVGRR